MTGCNSASKRVEHVKQVYVFAHRFALLAGIRLPAVFANLVRTYGHNSNSKYQELTF